MLEKIGNRIGSFLDANRDVAGRVDVKEPSSGPATGHAAVEGLVKAFEEIRIGEKIGMLTT